ncbi:MAG: response regulator transcription factor [Opitutaceae bacterium]
MQPISKDIPPVTAHRSGISVAIIEDDTAVREILTVWIAEAEGFSSAGVFADVESALEPITRCRPDVALVDINLPGLSGIDCVGRLKPLLPATQFVMLTVYDDSTHVFDALSAGATGYLLKCTPREALLVALREVHAGGSPMSSNIARKVVQSLHRAAPRRAATEGLSKRENEVLALLAQGYLYKEIADALGIGLETVNTYIRRIYEKLHVHSRAQAVARLANLPLGPGAKRGEY